MAQAPRERGEACPPQQAVSLAAFLACFSLLPDKPSWLFWLHCSHLSVCERSITDGLQGSTCICVVGVLRLGAVVRRTLHCWWHRELSDTGTLSRDTHVCDARSCGQRKEEGVAVSSCGVLVHGGKETELLNSTLYFNLIL